MSARLLGRLGRLGLLAALVVFASACSESGGDDGQLLPPDTFTLRVDGGAARTFRGSAFVSQEVGEGLFGVFLGTGRGPVGTGAAGDAYVSFMRFGGAPVAGAYRLADGLDTSGQMPSADAFLGFYFDPSQIAGGSDDEDLFLGSLLSRSGTLTIDQIDEEGVEGRFEMTAQAVQVTGFDPETPDAGEPMMVPVGEPITVEGEFNASFRSGLFNTIPTAHMAVSHGR